MISSPNLEFVSRRGRAWGRKDQEYLADFILIAKRVLDQFHYDLFRMHFLLGGSWQACCRQMKIDKGNFYHAIYRIEQRLGRAFRETEPYGLYPLDEYFGGTQRRLNLDTISNIPVNPDDEQIQFLAGVPLRAPLRAVGEK